MIKTEPLLKEKEASLLKKIKKYREVACEIKDYLDRHPNEWGRFQSEFNKEMNEIFREIMDFEKERLSMGDEESVYKLKKLFTGHLRKDFLHGEYTRWSFEKPCGYAGDFKIIDLIYRNEPSSTGFERLFDNYFQMSAAAVATRNRKEDFKKILAEFIEKRRPNRTIRIMDLASGPCRDLKEFLVESNSERAVFDCYENDENAIRFAQQLLRPFTNVNFYRQNVIKMALKRDIQSDIHAHYDMIFSTGLFDYLDARIAAMLIANLKKIIEKEGILVVSNYRDKYSNPSLHFMEWVGDWNLVYRTEEEFLAIFEAAGFSRFNLRLAYEQQGIMQYCFAV